MPAFPDIDLLIEASRPKPFVPWMAYASGGFILVAVITALFPSQNPDVQRSTQIITSGIFVLLMLSMGAASYLAIRANRAEAARLEAVEELLQLRRWPQALGLLTRMLSSQMRSQQSRVQALLFLTTVLARFHRFDDAIAVEENLLSEIRLDSNTTHALKLGRAMAMLREDRLLDADRAMSDLRRSPEASHSAGFALLEMYRDVKTGHCDEALKAFDAKLPMLRQQLGHRSADAYALAAKAYDFLGRASEAAVAYQKATLLAPAVELQRRYPEIVSLASKYPAALAPPEMA
jgi:tetratricopeptide (TPR) repeat protein